MSWYAHDLPRPERGVGSAHARPVTSVGRHIFVASSRIVPEPCSGVPTTRTRCESADRPCGDPRPSVAQ